MEIWRDKKSNLENETETAEYRFHLWQMRRRVFTSAAISLTGLMFIFYYFSTEKLARASILATILLLVIAIFTGAILDMIAIQAHYKKKTSRISDARRKLLKEAEKLIEEKRKSKEAAAAEESQSDS